MFNFKKNNFPTGFSSSLRQYFLCAQIYGRLLKCSRISVVRTINNHLHILKQKIHCTMCQLCPLLLPLDEDYSINIQSRNGKEDTRLLTRFSTVSTMSRLLTSPTSISPTTTANFILIFRIGTDGSMVPAGKTIEPEPAIIIIITGGSPAAEAPAAASCL